MYITVTAHPYLLNLLFYFPNTDVPSVVIVTLAPCVQTTKFCWPITGTVVEITVDHQTYSDQILKIV